MAISPTTIERERATAAPLPASGPVWGLALNPDATSAGAFAARLGLGTILLAHGLQKLGLFGGAGWTGTLHFFETQLGIPVPLGALAILLESVGGALLLAGLFARPVALLAIVHMFVAAAKVHAANGFFLNWSLEPGKGHGIEMNLALVALACVIVADGGGMLALDTALARLLDRRARPGPGPILPS